MTTSHMKSAALSFAFAAAALPQSAVADKYSEVGDIIQLALPISAFGMTYLKDDTQGRWQFIKSTGTTIALTHSIKFVAGKRRPDFSSDNSFPSGHTSAAFSGASFYYTRYGASWGIPAYALAAYTGWSRVHADRHYWDDVFAGASIAVLSNLYFVDPFDKNITIMPMQNGDAKGINFIVSNDAFNGKNQGPRKLSKFKPDFRFEFTFGPSRIKSNDLEQDIDKDFLKEQVNFDGADGSVTTAALSLQWFMDKRNTFNFYTQPFEIRDKGLVSETSEVTNAGNEVYARYQVWDNRIGWSYDLNPDSQWISKAGLSLLAQYSEGELYDKPEESNRLYKNSEWLFFPMVNASLGYRFTPNLDLTIDGTYGYNGTGRLGEAAVYLNYKLNRRWDVGVGYSYYDRNQSDSNTVEHIAFDSAFLKTGYSF